MPFTELFNNIHIIQTICLNYYQHLSSSKKKILNCWSLLWVMYCPYKAMCTYEGKDNVFEEPPTLLLNVSINNYFWPYTQFAVALSKYFLNQLPFHFQYPAQGSVLINLEMYIIIIMNTTLLSKAIMVSHKIIYW